MTSKPPRRFNIGDTVVWTSYVDGTKRTGTVRAHVDLNPDDPADADYDLTTNGPLYEVKFDRPEQVAEVDLSAPPPASLRAVDDEDPPR
jgi:hypothetical protein